MPTLEETVHQLSPTQGIIHTLDKTGDTRLIWDRNNEDEVDAARRLFNDLRSKHYTAYRAEGKEGSKGEVIRSFDPEAERIIMAPRLVGG